MQSAIDSLGADGGVVRTAALGWLSLLLASFALLDAGRRLGDRLCGDGSALLRAVASGIAAIWLLVLLSQALLWSGLYDRWVALPAAVALAAAVRLTVRPTAAPPLAGALWTWLARTARGPGLLLLVAAGAALLLLAMRALLQPPLGWDALTYHLPIPARWVQDGGYSPLRLPDAGFDYGHFPNGGELLSGWLLLHARTDLLVNLGNLPLLLLGVAAAAALARELGAGGAEAALAGGVAFAAPPLAAYATSQYVDLQLTAEAMAALLFLLRGARGGRTGDWLLGFAAVGLAAGSKHSGLALLLPALLALLCGRGRRRWLLTAAAGVALPWYLRNWLETRNPLYPFGVEVGGEQLLAPSPLAETLAAFVPPPPPDRFVAGLLQYSPAGAPLTFGPLLLLAAVGAAAGIAVLLRRRDFRALLLVGSLMLAEAAALASGEARLLRQYWPEVSQRFLAGSWTLGLVLGAAALGGAGPRARTAGTWLLGAAGCGELLLLRREVHGEGAALVAAVLLALAAAVLWLLPRRRLLAALLVLLVGMAGAPLLQAARDRTRGAAWTQAVDVHPIDTAAAAGWALLDDPARPLRIAFASGWMPPGQHWLLYPLFGRHLQNRVLYVPPTASGELGSCAPGRSPLATAAAWIARLRGQRVDTVFAQAPWPPELLWLETEPAFARLHADAGCRIYRLRAPATAPAGR